VARPCALRAARKHARLCGCRLARALGERIVTGRGCPRIVCWGVTSAGLGSRPVEVAATPIWLMNCCATLAETFCPSIGVWPPSRDPPT
jgi:hypothetical protein